MQNQGSREENMDKVSKRMKKRLVMFFRQYKKEYGQNVEFVRKYE